ncbi:fasciclin-2-like isoform X2 [Plodia interpunctella]|nr:fasciclin-2-like isoform X2 [Plodia interpunctella]
MVGTYKCQCDCGGKLNTLEQLELKVYNPLEIINTPEDQNIVLGENSEIKCEGWGGLGERYTWWDKPTNKETYKYNEVVNGLVINNVTEEDRGTFVCFVSDMETGAEVNRSINVKVISRPKIVDLYANPDTTVIVGNTLTMECEAVGTPTPTFSWHIEEPVNSSSNRKRKLGDNVRYEHNRMIIDNITAEDNGTYQCTASNIIGNDSYKIDIKVYVPPRIIEFNDTTVVEGTTMQIICDAVGRPKPDITIMYIGRDINGSKELTDEFIITSPFIPVTAAVEGYYICNATNVVDFETSMIYVTVLHKPIFKVEKETIWGWEGQNINLDCENDGNPNATVVWSYENPSIDDFSVKGEKYDEIESLLKNLNQGSEKNIAITITNTTDLYGLYRCTARNEYGESTKFMDFKEGFPPSVIANFTVDARSTEVIFRIPLPTGYQGPEVTGYIAEYDTEANYYITHIHPNRTWSVDRAADGLLLSNLIPSTRYNIKFAAINDVGTGMWTEMHYFDTLAPSPPSSPKWNSSSDEVHTNVTELLVLKWTPPVDNGATIDYYLIRYCRNCTADDGSCKELKMISTTEFHTNVLEPNTEYCVEVRAHNSVGLSEAAHITVAVGPLTMETSLSAGAIVGVAIVVVIVAFVILDLLLCLWKKQGMIANFYFKTSKKRINQIEHIRDKKGLLNDNKPSIIENTNKHKEFEYNKATGIITGKHSSV